MSRADKYEKIERIGEGKIEKEIILKSILFYFIL